jgi:hypothetical protein
LCCAGHRSAPFHLPLLRVVAGPRACCILSQRQVQAHRVPALNFCNILIMYADAATHVLRRVLEQFGSWTQWEQHCNGDFLPSDEVDRRVSAYLTRLRCNHVISVAWDSNIVAPTMLAGRRLLLRGPYRDGRVQSVSSSASVLFITVCSLGRQRCDPHLQVLDHEIGTHFVRKFNGKLQAKTAGKPKYPLQMRLETEEVIVRRQPYYIMHTNGSSFHQGLASINTVLAQRHVPRAPPATLRAHSSSFSSLSSSTPR